MSMCVKRKINTKDNVEYWQMIEELRSRLIDYYGTALYSGFVFAQADIVRVERMDDQELVREAQRIGIL